MSAEAHLVALFFECLFLNAFSDALFEASDSILEVLGFNFVHFGRLLGSFWTPLEGLGRTLEP